MCIVGGKDAHPPFLDLFPSLYRDTIVYIPGNRNPRTEKSFKRLPRHMIFSKNDSRARWKRWIGVSQAMGQFRGSLRIVFLTSREWKGNAKMYETDVDLLSFQTLAYGKKNLGQRLKLVALKGTACIEFLQFTLRIVEMIGTRKTRFRAKQVKHTYKYNIKSRIKLNLKRAILINNYLQTTLFEQLNIP